MPESKETKPREECVAIHWYRHGLRLHDNPAMLESIRVAKTLYPIFIFDGKVAGTFNSGYNRWCFLLQSLQDLDDSFRQRGGRLWIFHGCPKEILSRLVPLLGVTHVSYEIDMEPIWQERDCGVIELLGKLGVETIPRISYTLWDPREVIKANGGSPPLTFDLFVLTVSTMEDPPQPAEDPDFSAVDLVDNDTILPEDLASRNHIPTLEEMGVEEDVTGQMESYIWTGGEKYALSKLELRLEKERKAVLEGKLQSNINKPDLVSASRSLSPFIRFGCVSVRLFYHKIMEIYRSDPQLKEFMIHSPAALTAQLIWREYFYTMSVNNAHFDTIEQNPVCLPIPWAENEEHLQAWKDGATGYPWIDALQKQLLLEGWTHHIGRHASAHFLTRGDLWISWVPGFRHFIKYQIDGDWAVGAGNWMWVSSSAFEKALDCAKCMCPVNYGRRMDPTGAYVKRYLPQLKNMPLRYLFNPWMAPEHVQKEAGCIIGEDYPHPIVDHKFVSKRNTKWMEEFKETVVERLSHHVRSTTYSEEELKMCALQSHASNCIDCHQRQRERENGDGNSSGEESSADYSEMD